MDTRRGSGISIPATATGNIFQPNEPVKLPPPQDQVNIGMYQFPGHLSYASLYPQPGPLLMNPPPYPTMQYGVPPSPFIPAHPASLPPPASSYQPQPKPLRRAGSINAKIYSAEARRPFAQPARQEPGKFEAGEVEGVQMQMQDEGSVVDQLRDRQGKTEEHFMDRIREWETASQQAYAVRKVEDEGELPGLMIEEMMESASVVGDGNQEGGTVGKESQAVSVLGKEQFSAALAVPSKAPLKWRQGTPLNTAVMFVPQGEAWLVERMGRYHRTLEPGMNVLVPIIDKVRYVQSLKEIAIDIPSQQAVTSDNVPVNIDGVLFLHITDTFKASYEVEDPEFALTQLCLTSTRGELGKLPVDQLFKERENVAAAILESLNAACGSWGITCIRYQIRDMRLPIRVQEAMQMEVEAERRKRAAVLESEGIMQAEINVAEGKKQAQILEAEAGKQGVILAAQGEAQAVVAAGEARARSIEAVAGALGVQNGQAAASLAIAEKYVTAFGELAKSSTTMLLPGNPSDVGSAVAQAMAIYGKVGATTPLATVKEEEEGEA